MFSVRQDEGFPEREERVLEFWRKEGIFEASLENRKGSPLFSTYDGPPFATGLPHYGHLLAGTIKDVIPRYKTMKGYYVPRRFGWDCHGLPIENEIEKAQQLSGAASIEKFGIANFNEECRKIVLRYSEQWKSTVERSGRWVDFSKTYRTMDPSFMESVWWVFKRLYEEGLIYEGFKVMPYSMKLGTPLSNFEANLNYQDVDDPSLTVKFAVEGEPNTFFLAWTTTPWTLPSNLALIVGPDIDYVKVKDKSGEIYILAKARLEQHFKEDFEVLSSMKGEQLKGLRYAPLFPFFADQEGAFKVIADSFVTVEDGTGIVHAAPAFGETDFFACKNEGIEIVCPVDSNGKFTKEVPPFEGMMVKDADKDIIRTLKKEGKVFLHTQIHHRYPFCWRSDTPLIYKAVETWFVAVEKIKEKLLNANSQVHWVPEHIKDGRFGKWLVNARDWAISRNRYWGTPIPIWKSDDGDIWVMGSIKELEEKTGAQIVDLHRHFIDPLTFTHKGKTYKRITEVFDCWFESGSMPYAENHYPFENKSETEKAFPADFIAEGLDQTRGWFYTLTVLAAGLFNKPAFKNVIVNGIILAEDGMKMSKRLKNYPEPTDVIHRFGADALRLYMLNSPAVKADDMRFSEKGVELILRQILIPLWNSYVFLSTYAQIYHWKPSEPKKPEALIDRWILSLVNKLTIEVETALDQYDLSRAVEPFVGFIDQLTNWYIRRSRARFWSDVDSPDRRDAFQTLYTVLKTLVKIAAPFVPFISDAIYRELRTEKDPASVHLCDFPKYQKEVRNHELEREMEYAQRAVSIGHALRKEHKLKVRQPLPRAHIAVSEPEVFAALEKQKNLIADELNVKVVDFHKEEGQFVKISVVPNFRILGKKIGKLMPEMQKLMQGFDKKQIQILAQGNPLIVELHGEKIELTQEDVTVQRIVKEGIAAGNDQELVVALETHLSPELLLEGLAREIVNKINTMRRDRDFHVTDRIHVRIQCTERIKACFDQYREYIANEVLAIDVVYGPCEGDVLDLNGEEAVIMLERVVHK
jgi:isoleucyl-tRNA synthetase